MANEGLGWDSLLKMLHVILVVTGILGGGTTLDIPSRVKVFLDVSHGSSMTIGYTSYLSIFHPAMLIPK